MIDLQIYPQNPLMKCFCFQVFAHALLVPISISMLINVIVFLRHIALTTVLFCFLFPFRSYTTYPELG